MAKESHNELKITRREISQLAPYPNNAQTHSKPQIRKIAESIRSFGFTNPILIDARDTIVAGHGRVEAAKLLKLSEIPTIRLENLTPAQVRAYVIADNRLAEEAGWDNEILKIELQNLLLDTEFDVTLTGFEIPQIDLLLQESTQKAEEPVDIPPSGPPVTQMGDMWLLGKHRVLCADALERDSFTRLMGGRKADVVFIDPPYNVPVDGHIWGNGSVRHREFQMASGEMSEEQFIAFLTQSLKLLAESSKAGSVHYVCIDWRHIGELLAAGKQTYDTLLNLCVWAKDKGGMGSLYRSRHELILVYRNGGRPHRNNIQLGRFGRNRTNIWSYPGANTLSRQGDDGNLLALHPTVKPVAMVADALLDCSAPGNLVVDSFLGSGSTLLAAERSGRICYGLEIDPLYVDTVIRRWQRETGLEAVHAKGKQRFSEVEVANA